MMDKDHKLKRYRRKDYREIVEFPVEIVGRDGVVRRYDFDESIRLYQRRMSFAPMRFGDDDVVAAEQGHCRARIEQLRRSFFHLRGWNSRAGQEGPEVVDPAMAGELAAFLVRVFREAGRLSVAFSRLDAHTPGGQVWWMERQGREGGFLLYGYLFGTARGEAAHEAFVKRLGLLRASEGIAGDAERMIAFHHSGDCGFVLTGRADDVADLAALAPDTEDAPGGDPTSWDEVASFVRRGDLPTAFLRCRWILEGQPWHRDAYAAGAMLALALRRPDEAEDLAFVGTRYFPRDGLLLHYLGIARLHQDRLVEAEVALRQALRCEPELLVARSAWALVLWRLGRKFAAVRALVAPGPTGKAPAGQEIVAHAGLATALVRVCAAASLGVLAGLGAALLVGVQGVAAWPSLLAIGLVAVACASWLRAGMDAASERVYHEEVVQGLQRIERRRLAPAEI